MAWNEFSSWIQRIIDRHSGEKLVEFSFQKGELSERKFASHSLRMHSNRKQNISKALESFEFVKKWWKKNKTKHSTKWTLFSYLFNTKQKLSELKKKGLLFESIILQYTNFGRMFHLWNNSVHISYKLQIDRTICWTDTELERSKQQLNGIFFVNTICIDRYIVIKLTVDSSMQLKIKNKKKS